MGSTNLRCMRVGMGLEYGCVAQIRRTDSHGLGIPHGDRSYEYRRPTSSDRVLRPDSRHGFTTHTWGSADLRDANSPTRFVARTGSADSSHSPHHQHIFATGNLTRSVKPPATHNAPKIRTHAPPITPYRLQNHGLHTHQHDTVSSTPPNTNAEHPASAVGIHMNLRQQ